MHSNKNDSLISIIMPAYNAASYIEQAIDSILAQTYRNWELLIADDGSKDNTKAIIDSYKDPRIKTFHNETNIGYLKTCNKLFTLCQGDYIGFQDADDYSEANRIELQLAEFIKKPSLGLCACFSRYFFHETGETFKFRESLTTDADIKENMKTHNQFDGASIIIRKDILDRIGGYKDFFDRIYSEDYDWANRIVEKYECYNLPKHLYHVRVAESSLTKMITNPMQIISEKAVHFLVRQRMNNNGEDGLGNLKELNSAFNDFIASELAKFEADPALLWRIAAGKAMYSKLYKNAIKASVNSIKAAPFKFINYRTLFYCFRHSLLAKFKK